LLEDLLEEQLEKLYINKLVLQEKVKELLEDKLQEIEELDT